MLFTSICISQEDHSDLMKMYEKWFRFKVLREEGAFKEEPTDGWLTMLQREKMLDDVFVKLGFQRKL